VPPALEHERIRQQANPRLRGETRSEQEVSVAAQQRDAGAAGNRTKQLDDGSGERVVVIVSYPDLEQVAEHEQLVAPTKAGAEAGQSLEDSRPRWIEVQIGNERHAHAWK
jgi:hypothetical protein